MDALDDQGMEAAQQRLTRLGDAELSEQCTNYEQTLGNEDQRDTYDQDTNMVKMRLDMVMSMVMVKMRLDTHLECLASWK